MKPNLLVLISLSTAGMATIQSTPGLPQQEQEWVQRWREAGILQQFFISVSKKEAVLIFDQVEESEARQMIASLPYFPYMEQVAYHSLHRQF